MPKINLADPDACAVRTKSHDSEHSFEAEHIAVLLKLRLTKTNLIS